MSEYRVKVNVLQPFFGSITTAYLSQRKKCHKKLLFFLQDSVAISKTKVQKEEATTTTVQGVTDRRHRVHLQQLGQ